MVDTYALGAYAAMCKSSSLLGGTKNNCKKLLKSLVVSNKLLTFATVKDGLLV